VIDGSGEQIDTVELVRSCLASDADGWTAFVTRFQQPVFGLCLRMLRHRQDAEDVAQDSLVRAIRNLHRWDPQRPLLPWLLTITANRCRTALQRRNRRPLASDFAIEPAQAASRQPDGEIAEEVTLALEELRDEYRECFILFYQAELGCAEISEVMGCPVGTVKTWLHRARNQVAERLRRRGMTGETIHELQ
jgi:RNA polymerase sigma-70 factor, ECF subfamily